MPRCSVLVCKNSSCNVNYVKDGISFHTFPGDPFRCAEWISIVAKERGEEIYKPYKNSTICSIHFDRLDITGNTQRRRLLKTAVPKLQIHRPVKVQSAVCSKLTNNLSHQTTPTATASHPEIPTLGEESNVSEQDSNHSWIVKCESVDIEKDEPELSDDVPDNLSLYCDDDTSSATSKGDKDEQRHEGYQCDNCNSDIIGYRYTCVQCNNFDVCFACESRGAHPHHYMLRVPAPRPFTEIQTVLVTIRKYLMEKLDPISTKEFENEDAISVKSEIKSETMDMDEDIEDAEQVVDTSNEYAVNHELTQHMTNTDFEEASQSDQAVPRQVKVSNSTQEITEKPIQKVRLAKSDVETPEAQGKISNAQDTNQSPMIINKCKIVTPSTAKRKIVIQRSDLVELEQSNLLAKKLCVVSTSAQETMKKPIILSRKPALKLLNIPLSTLQKQGQTTSSQLCHQQESKITATDRKS